MDTWAFWEQYHLAIDRLPKREIEDSVHTLDTHSSLRLDRETHEKVSRFLYCLQQMPRAWGARPWSSHEIIRAGNNISNDLFRRKMKRELGL